MKVAFVLFIVFSNGYGGVPIVIDNLESKAACELLLRQIAVDFSVRGECYPAKRPADPDGGAV